MKSAFRHFDLKIVYPEFQSSLTDTIIELEHLRKKQLHGSTHPKIFFQLKEIFHLLESLGSTRIEGNYTTIEEYVETKIDPTATISQNIMEIRNSERAMQFIDENIKESSHISKALILELHRKTVQDLVSEGDRTPGFFRTGNVQIAGSSHIPPEALHVERYMEELIDLINKGNDPKYDLLKTSITHHRFAWIHPFNNGNGRTVRLLTYAMLIKQGFNVKNGRILNPTAVFCINRDNYYKNLSTADRGTEKAILHWCQYVLNGLLREIEKIDRLTDYHFLSNNILRPAIEYCLERRQITKLDGAILKKALLVPKQELCAADIGDLVPKSPAQKSRVISKMKKSRLIIPIIPNGRKYVISFSNNFLLRGIVDSLAREGFIPLKE